LSVYHWERLGMAAGISYTLTIVLSIRPIRAVAYEFFYSAHIVLVLSVSLRFAILPLLHAI
jgi:hypothetical protein